MAAAIPQVTVLLPVRNGAAHLREAIDSILRQTFSDFELLIIDDGSTDATPEIIRAVRDPRVRHVENQENLGLVATLNRGLELARGELIARQDHDDISRVDRLEKQVMFLRENPNVALAGTEAFATSEDGRIGYRMLRPLSAESIRWYLCFDNAFIHSSVMFRSYLIRTEFGGYPHSFHSEDYALWSSVARLRPTANLPEPLVRYREHAASVTGGMSPEDAVSFDQATRGIRLENLRTVFGEAADVEDARILSSYRRPFSVESAGELLGVLDRLVQVQGARIATSADLRRTVGIQLAELAYRLLPLARWKAASLYFRAFRRHPPIAFGLPWPRVIALFLLGERARALYLRLTSRS